MPSNERETLEFPIGRWILWGLVAAAGVALVVFFFIRLGEDVEESSPPPVEAEQVEWSIVLVDMTGDTVILRGDLPRGNPTETWQGDFMIERDTTGSFEWDLDQGLPMPVVEINAIESCDEFNQELDKWLQQVEAAEGEGYSWRGRAFTQHTLNRMRAQECAIDDAALTGL